MAYINGLLTILVASLLFAALALFSIRTARELKRLRAYVLDMSKKLPPLWLAVQDQIAKDLHQPHPRYQETDALLKKLEALDIQPEEKSRLEILLEERSRDMSDDVTEMQRQEAGILVKVMKIVLLDAEKRTQRHLKQDQSRGKDWK